MNNDSARTTAQRILETPDDHTIFVKRELTPVLKTICRAFLEGQEWVADVEPEESGWYTVTLTDEVNRDGDFTWRVFYNVGHGWHVNPAINRVTAYKPEPKPYRPEPEDEEQD